eukprot:TRINITY_DN9292_c0_g4_i1.p1 TRINITY_DN9292_c0_g4~~TRINITY_DN9292_c0_g4_i1.p1  ORF type:complete len:920 (+),score=250.89 TRINITY_DN9292_c0_g4_i1:177-2936(+)
MEADAANAEGGKKKKIKPGSFQGLGLSQATYKAVMRMGYRMPTPIQRKTIPTILEGQDVIAMARTGSGKTAAFLIPTIERLKEHSVAVGVRAVVLSPTRELAMQTAKFCRKLGKFSGLRCCLLVGGQAMETQFEHLANNPDIIIATPGRLTHHMLEADLSLARVEILIMDEADRLFELGFAEQLQKVLEATPVSRQCLLFSATLPAQLVAFSRAGVRNPYIVRLDVETTLSEALELQFLYVRKDEKLAAAVSVLRRLYKDGKSTIMFVATRHHVEFFGELLGQIGLSAAIVYGNMDQVAREEQIAKFRNKKAGILVTTDVAARGVDIPLLDHVLNYDFPPSAKLFVHRSGRTARAGRSGLAVSLVTMEDLPYTVELMLFLGQKLTVPGTADGTGGEKRHLLGAVPSLEHEVEQLEKLLEEEGTVIRSLHKSMMMSYGLYNKTRPSASRQSCQRAKELLEECGGPARLQGLIHPAFKDEKGGSVAGQPGRGVGSAGTDEGSFAYIQELRGYRPKVQKLGNVISAEAMKVMEQAKSDAAVVKAAKADFGSDSEADCDASGSEEAAAGGRAARSRKRKMSRGSATKRAALAEAPTPQREREGPRMSKRARKLSKLGLASGGSGSALPDFSGFDVKIDGQTVGGDDEGERKKKKDAAPQFVLSVERDTKSDAKERGLDMGEYQLDLMPDDDGQIKSSKSVIRWDARKKKYLPVMVAADGRVLKSKSQVNESGKKVKGKEEKSNLYQKWAKASKLRVQRPGEMEQGGVNPMGKRRKAELAKTVAFDDAGAAVAGEGADGKKKKPVVPFHGQIEEKYLTNKQKRIMARRAKTDRVIDGKAKSEIKTPAQIQKEKKLREKKKLKQNPHLRKAKKLQAKEKRINRLEERQMQYGARTRSKMLVFDGPKKWRGGKARPKTGHGPKGAF